MEGGHLNFKIYMESLEKNKNPTEDKFGKPDTGKREREPVLITNSTDVFIYQKTSIASSRPYLDSTARASHLAPNQP